MQGHPRQMGHSESWTIRKAECQRIDTFKLWCWRRFLRVPWTARRLNQSILKEISAEYSLEGLMLKLKLQYLGHRLIGKDPDAWCWERLKAGGWDGWMPWPTQRTWVWARSIRWWRTEKPGVLQSMGLQSIRHNWATEQQQHRIWVSSSIHRQSSRK